MPPPPHLRRPHEAADGTLSRDTDPRAEAVQLEIYRNMPTWEKARRVSEAIRANRLLLEAGLRDRYPKAGDDEIRRRLMDLTLGAELAERVYGKSPFDS